MTHDSCRPIITLTTDFGLGDHYVGTMKGVILTRCADAQIVDISHDVRQFSIWAGAYAIYQAAPYFPEGTTHLVVVDPGVGTVRRALLLESRKQRFIAPDNGVLSMLVTRDPDAVTREITNEKLWLPERSNTFHGRDVFAPLAAVLASGYASAEVVGPVISDMVLLPGIEPVEIEPRVWSGRILSIDRFGNVITNFANSLAGLEEGKAQVSVGTWQISEFRKTFAEARKGLVFAYLGSSGFVELGMNRQSAAESLQAAPGDTVLLRM